MWSAECERDGPSVSMIAWSDSDSVAFGISSHWTTQSFTLLYVCSTCVHRS